MENQTQQPNQQPSQNQTPMDEQKREKNKRIAIALVALAAVVLVGGMLLLQQAGLRPSSPAPVEQPTPSPQPQSQDESGSPRDQAELDFAGWQTYRNDEFGFEVKYPWVDYERPTRIIHRGYGAIQPQFSLAIPPKEHADIEWITIKLYDFSSYFLEDEATGGRYTYDVEKKIWMVGNAVVNERKGADLETVKFNNWVGYRVHLEEKEGNYTHSMNYVLVPWKKKNRVVEIAFGSLPNTIREAPRDQILSTFRFVE